MTDQELEQRLRAWYRADVGETEVAPTDLRDSLAAIPPRTASPVRRFGRRRRITLLAGRRDPGRRRGAGRWVWHRQADIGRGRTTVARSVDRASPDPSPGLETPRATERATPSPATALGGGMLLVRDIPRDANGTPIDTVHGFGTGSYDVSLVDPETGARTLLGTVPYDWRTGYQPEFRWASDGRHAMITDRRGKLWTLDSPTAAANQVVFACCERPGVVGWAFSPRGDRMAGLLPSPRRRFAGQRKAYGRRRRDRRLQCRWDWARDPAAAEGCRHGCGRNHVVMGA